MLRLNISGKLSGGFTAVLIVMAVASGAAYVEVSRASDASANNSAVSDILNQVDNALESALEAVNAERGMMLMQDPALGKVYHDSAASFDVALLSARKRAADYAKGAEARTYLDKVSASFTSWRKGVMDPIVDGGVGPTTAEKSAAIIRSGQSTNLRNAFEASASDLKQRLTEWSDDDQKAEDASVAEAKIVQAVGFLIALVVSILISWRLSRAISRPLVAMTNTMSELAGGQLDVAVPAKERSDEIGAMAQAVQVFKDAAIEKLRLEQDAESARQAAEVERARVEEERAEVAAKQAAVVDGVATGLERLAEGDLVYRLLTAFAPEYEKLRSDFNLAMGKLHDVMSMVAANAGTIRTGSSEIAMAANDLSRRTEQQAASLEETAAALDEITATVKKTSDSAGHAYSVVATARHDAEDSGAVVAQAVEAMTAIDQSSSRVSQIIGVIDEIAFQTNLLALNAGVEAARAGDAGRGFAVVASEVRALAQRSAEAAKEIKALIHTSTVQVQEGVGLVGETGRSLQRIVMQVSDIAAIVADIAASAKEQATGLDQVNIAINQMDQVTQQNAAMVEQSTAASSSLKHETDELANLIGRFKLEGSSRSGQAHGRESVMRSAPLSKAA